jgi:FAD/FMN-containing dehydrogenase
MLSVDREKLVARVQPGLALADMNRVLAKDRLVFGPDPPTRAVTTIGSVLAIDTLGSHFLRFGTAGATLLSAQCVLADGHQVNLERSNWRMPNSSNAKLNYLVSEVGQLLWTHKFTRTTIGWDSIDKTFLIKASISLGCP